MEQAISKSKPILQEAVTLDREEKNMEAVEKYTEGVSLLLEAIYYAEEDAKGKLREIACKYISRAEGLKGRARLKVDHLEQRKIKDGSTGHGYDKVFASCLDNKVTTVTVEDAYIIAHHQIQNFVRFCELCVSKLENLKKISLITQKDVLNVDAFSELSRSLERFGIKLEVTFKSTLHDREIRFDNGWIVKIGRGLDYFKNPGRYGLGMSDLNFRSCHETTVDIFRMV
ncbi:hypothetical protein AB6A40_002321 [Gnathostoma spinigerum]|uniref:MIT domain-containing protein n=1 Tax=Gnathostoma spinigerum TaxID=75299 RepID=A0ABD6E8I6_9BILA